MTLSLEGDHFRWGTLLRHKYKYKYKYFRWGTLPRHKHLLNTKYFSCSCPRCLDPAECGSLSSALRSSRIIITTIIITNYAPAQMSQWGLSWRSASFSISNFASKQSPRLGLQQMFSYSITPSCSNGAKLRSANGTYSRSWSWGSSSFVGEAACLVPSKPLHLAEVKMAAVKEWGDEDLVRSKI